eukprot:EG_transcript_23659
MASQTYHSGPQPMVMQPMKVPVIPAPEPMEGQVDYEPPPVQTMQVSQGVPMAPLPRFGENPQLIMCPNCNAQGMSDIRKEISIMNWAVCGAACLFGFFCCAPIAFFVDSLKGTVHYCRKCNAQVGKFN